MSTPARVPTGVPTGGQFATTAKPETNLRLVQATSSVAAMPDLPALARDFPNRYQRCDVVNSQLHDFVADINTPAVERLGAARMAVRHTDEVHGRFVSLPEDDGEAESFVRAALASDQKVHQALDAVGTLDSTVTRSYGNRLAGALFDIESAEREQRVSRRAIEQSKGLTPAPFNLSEPPPADLASPVTW